MPTAQLIAQNITKQFTQGTTSIEVLKGISTAFAQNSTYAITGASGSGKSTLLHLLAGIDHPTTGAVLFNGQDITSVSDEQRTDFLTHSVGLVFQLPYLIQELSVIENIGLKGLIDGKSYNESLEQAHNLLKAIGLEQKATASPATLSGGQQQRIAIARALFNKPAFLLADEPTGNLDEKTGASIIDFIHDCQKQWGMGLIISSHDTYVARTMQHTLQLHDGHLTSKGF